MQVQRASRQSSRSAPAGNAFTDDSPAEHQLAAAHGRASRSYAAGPPHWRSGIDEAWARQGRPWRPVRPVEPGRPAAGVGSRGRWGVVASSRKQSYLQFCGQTPRRRPDHQAPGTTPSINQGDDGENFPGDGDQKLLQ